MTKQGNYGEEPKAEKPKAGEAKPATERPHGEPQPSEGHQPVDIKGESRHTPQLQPGTDPNDKARHTAR